MKMHGACQIIIIHAIVIITCFRFMFLKKIYKDKANFILHRSMVMNSHLDKVFTSNLVRLNYVIISVRETIFKTVLRARTTMT